MSTSCQRNSAVNAGASSGFAVWAVTGSHRRLPPFKGGSGSLTEDGALDAAHPDQADGKTTIVIAQTSAIISMS